MNKDYVCNNRKCRYHDATMIMHCARSISAEDDRPYALVCREYMPPERGNGIRERPILFSGAMVRAILEGRKTMTRRVVKPVPSDVWGHGVVTDTRSTKFGKFCVHMRGEFCGDVHVDCPYGAPGDRLWVRETFWHRETFHADYLMDYRYCATEPTPPGSVDQNDYHTLEGYWRKMPSIFMPRDASRITLEVTGVRVERLREINEQDAIAEGVQWPKHEDFEPVTLNFVTFGPARIAFKELWCNINGDASWDANPWVWVVEFRMVENTKGEAQK